MAYKIAAASSDGVYIDLSFGAADSFYIYEIDEENQYHFCEIRKYTENAGTDFTSYQEACHDTGCSGIAGNRESMLILLDQNGICGSSGSACTSGSLDPSHVLLAIGLPHEIAHGSLRLTLSEKTTKEDIDFTVDTLKKIIERLRNMSPLYEDFVKNQAK